jgi:SAM-dependent methyltransferase
MQMKQRLRKIYHGIRANVKSVFVGIHQLYYGFAESKVECNICHCKDNRMSSETWHKYSMCLKCGSGVRQRLLWAALLKLDEVGINKIIKNKAVLHFAPENVLRDLIRDHSASYKTADFLAEGYDYKDIDLNIDMSDMKEVKDAQFDCVIACDVLEHVPNHLAAIRETNRVLKKGGYCILTVPQKDHLEKTLEDLTITDPKERERKFGQRDHLRIYGNDFVQILTDAGFDVTAVDETYFDPETVQRNVLFPPVLSKHPLATNYRKVFFGRKI